MEGRERERVRRGRGEAPTAARTEFSSSQKNPARRRWSIILSEASVKASSRLRFLQFLGGLDSRFRPPPRPTPPHHHHVEEELSGRQGGPPGSGLRGERSAERRQLRESPQRELHPSEMCERCFYSPLVPQRVCECVSVLQFPAVEQI